MTRTDLPQSSQAHSWKYFLALGDSFTVGIGDVAEGFENRGAVDRLASTLRRATPEMRYVNLARRGLLAHEVLEEQLEPALKLEPDLVSVIAGANDILKPHYDYQRFADAMRTMFSALHARQVALVTSNSPLYPIIRTLPGKHADIMRQRIQELNTFIANLSAEQGVPMLDAWTYSQEAPENHWSTDGVHPNARGYAEIGQRLTATLARHHNLQLEMSPSQVTT